RQLRVGVDPKRPAGRGERAVPAVVGVREQPVDSYRVTGGARVAGEREEVLDGCLEAVDVAERPFDRSVPVRPRVDQRRLELEAEPGEGSAELMRCVGAERSLTPHER